MKKISGMIEYDRFIVPYRIYGDGPDTLLCVSGAKQTMSAWRSVVSCFFKEYRVVVFDMPGQGRSEIVSGSNRVALDEQIEVVHALVEHLNLQNHARSFIVGGSWGSIVAAAYVAKYPEVFDRTILGSFGTKPNVVLSSVIDDVKVMIETGRGQDIAGLMIERFGQNIPDTLKRMIITQFEAMSDQHYQSLYEHATFVTEMADLKDYVDLSKVTIPALVIMGQLDTIMDLFDAKKAAQLMPNSQYRVVKGVGHFLHWESEAILDIYRDFFEQEQRALQKVL